MRIIFNIKPSAWSEYFINFLRALFFNTSVFSVSESGEEKGDLKITVKVTEKSDGLEIKAKYFFDNRHDERSRFLSRGLLEYYHSFSEESNKIKAVKLFLIELLGDILQRSFPWGILVGVRPTKVAHQLIEKGYSHGQSLKILQGNYGLAEDKARLLLEVAQRQRVFFSTPVKISIYIGIPYCPTRCLYCSFPSYPLKAGDKQNFLSALLSEIELIGSKVQEHGLEVETLYIGGGTPAVLETPEILQLFSVLYRVLSLKDCKEITFEAGRPDAITEDKLLACKEAGVNRISINPQTMQERTLRIIGRQHSVGQVFEAVELARKVGIKVLNMDIIAGLPGETAADMNDTLKEIGKLQPENLTVHTLTIKRASSLRQDFGNIELPCNDEVKGMLDAVAVYARQQKMFPYYLYRQKHMLGHLENIGYAKQGFEGIYNIQMMEDRQTILGFGAGAGSKFLCADGNLIRLDNPKDPLMYIQNLDEYVRKKMTMLAQSAGTY